MSRIRFQSFICSTNVYIKMPYEEFNLEFQHENQILLVHKVK